MKSFTLMLAFFFLIGLSVPSNAILIAIGTAEYQGNNYNLIWEDEQDLVWLDYSSISGSPVGSWENQLSWASGLNVAGVLGLNFEEYNVSWTGDWRLSSAGSNPQSGSHQTSSEIGHLFYVSLDNEFNSGTLKTGPFDDLETYEYWTGTEYDEDNAWAFGLDDGGQFISDKERYHSALAVREATVTPVPEPSTLLLLGFGLLGLIGFGRRKLFS